jgi:hypothetical protein
MSSATPLGPITDPDLRLVLQTLKSEISYGMNCHQVGKLISYDPASQTASVQLLAKRVVFNQPQTINGKLQLTPTLVDYPPLVDCPVFIASGGGGRLTFPTAAGDPCLVLFNDRDLDNWFTTGAVTEPNSQRSHSLSDGLVLIGFRNQQNVYTDINPAYTQLRLGNAVLTMRDDGTVELDSAVGSFIKLENKISITNSSTSLKSVLDNLCVALTAWVNTGGTTPNPATVTAINAVKTQIDSILQ